MCKAGKSSHPHPHPAAPETGNQPPPEDERYPLDGALDGLSPPLVPGRHGMKDAWRCGLHTRVADQPCLSYWIFLNLRTIDHKARRHRAVTAP